jgi:hypothetical protein
MVKPSAKRQWNVGSFFITVLMLLAGRGGVQAQDAQTRMHIMHDLGGPFIIYRDWVQTELKLTDTQKQKLLDKQQEYVQETMQVEGKLKDKQDDEWEQAMQSHRAKSAAKFWPVLKVILKDDQFTRFQQLELQHEGPAGVFRPEIVKVLKITDEQRQQFMRVIEDLQTTIKPLLKAAQSGSNPQEIRPKVIKIIEDHEITIETLMNPQQRKQWQAMRGKPFNTL